MATGTWGGDIGDSRVFHAKIFWLHGGQQCQTGFHLRDMGVAGQTPEDVANAVRDFAVAEFRKLIHTSGELTGVDAVNLVTAEGHQIALTGQAGLHAGFPAPTGLMVPVSYVGGLRKRYANGRGFWPVGSTETASGNTMTSTALALYGGVVDALEAAFMDDGLTAELRLVHLHAAKPERPKAGGGTLPAVPATWYDVTAVKVNRVLSWASSRRPGSGS